MMSVSAMSVPPCRAALAQTPPPPIIRNDFSDSHAHGRVFLVFVLAGPQFIDASRAIFMIICNEDVAHNMNSKCTPLSSSFPSRV